MKITTKKNTWPKVSLILLTFNGGKGVKDCLESVKKQEYPKDKVEIIVVDNGSSDNSVTIARKYTKHVYINLQDVYRNRADGMRMATGEYIYMILEQDMEFKSKDFLKKMLEPLLENKNIAASFTREYPRKDQSWVTRFISYDPMQRDPLFEYLTPSIESTIVKKKNDYFISKLSVKRLPPVTHMLFRKSALKNSPVWKQKKDFDHDTVIGIIKAGFNQFAYVPEAGTYHHHAKDLKQLVGKRVRNLNNHFFPYNSSTEYKWIDLNKRLNVLRLIIWVIYANLFVPALLRGSYRAIKFRDWVLLLEPIIAIVTTDRVLLEFIRNETGRLILINSFKKFLK